jgi:outer membrane protein assembly factor BamB
MKRNLVAFMVMVLLIYTLEAQNWPQWRGPDVATPIAIDGKVYIVNFKGKLWCLDIKTGNELWQIELPKGKGVIYSSPILEDFSPPSFLCLRRPTFYRTKK